MYVFLLVSGAVATAAGFALIASGVPVHEFGLGSTLIISGTTCAIGGVILIGLGLVVRELQRIERAVGASAMPRPVGLADAGAAAAPSERAQPPARIPFPPKPKTEARPRIEASASAAPGPAPAPIEETAFDRLRQKFPSLARIESAPVVEATEVSLSPRTSPRPEEYVADTRNGAPPAGQTNGGEPAQTAPRLDMPGRPALPPERSSKIAAFDSFWPKDTRRGKPGAEPPQPPESEAPRSAANGAPHEPVPQGLAPHEAAPQPPEPISILKSGVVDGMAYTLYSDGSIEAQLPQGTVRFGSITDLRLHLEKHG